MILDLKAIFLILLTLFGGLSASSAAVKCEDVFATETHMRDLLVSIQKLSELKLQIELAKIDGFLSVVKTTLEHDYEEKYHEMVVYLEKTQIMTRKELSILVGWHSLQNGRLSFYPVT